ncbi:MAG: hypothetical protein JRG89_04475 [Deltaproteobacteria bacterium]|nr:hypothetical protein [Deltaproteobacteria bacterium]
MAAEGELSKFETTSVRALLVLAVALLCLSSCERSLPEQIALAPDAPLSRFLQLLSVSRVADGERIAVAEQFDAARQSPRQMHERGAAALFDRLLDSPTEGGVDGRWVLGEPTWDALGFTRQRSGGEAREGLWAHPRDGTVLLIEGRFRSTAQRLLGFHGFSDYSLEQATRMEIEDPVHFELRVDGSLIYLADVARTAGWQGFEAKLPASTTAGERALEIRISSDRDKWSHFVFDLWSEAQASSGGTGSSDGS